MVQDPNVLSRVGATIALNSIAGDLVRLLAEASVPTLVLKGPAIAARLYDDGTPRPHDDIDLLLPSEAAGPAEAALHGLGFRLAGGSPARAWIRRDDGVAVDLHTTLVGVGSSEEAVWRELSAGARRLRVGGTEVDVPDDTGLAFHVALHAAQHGVQAAKALEDLRRAVGRFPAATWEQAALLARRLEAVSAFAAGLRLVPEGVALAATLALPEGGSPEVALRAASPPPTAMGIYRLATTPGLRGKARLLAAELAPAPTFMRAVYPIARRGRAGLAVSYLWRPLWLVWHAGPAFRAWRRARG